MLDKEWKAFQNENRNGNAQNRCIPNPVTKQVGENLHQHKPYQSKPHQPCFNFLDLTLRSSLLRILDVNVIYKGDSSLCHSEQDEKPKHLLS